MKLDIDHDYHFTIPARASGTNHTPHGNAPDGGMSLGESVFIPAGSRRNATLKALARALGRDVTTRVEKDPNGTVLGTRVWRLA